MAVRPTFCFFCFYISLHGVMSWRDFLRLFAQRSKRLKKTMKSSASFSGEQPALNNGSSISSTSCPEKTSTTIHRYEGNRRFHNEQDVNYLLPTDAEGACVLIHYHDKH